MAKNDKVNVNVEVADVVVEEKQPAVDVVVVEPVSKDKKVKVKLRISFRQYIGDKWFDFVAGEERLVPEFIKDMLQERGALDVL